MTDVLVQALLFPADFEYTACQLGHMVVLAQKPHFISVEFPFDCSSDRSPCLNWENKEEFCSQIFWLNNSMAFPMHDEKGNRKSSKLKEEK